MNQASIRPMETYQDRGLLVDYHYNQQQQQQQLQSQDESSYKTICNGSRSSSIIRSNSNISDDKKYSDNDTDKQEQCRTAVKSLGPYDIICGRGSVAFNNIGNRRFRILIGLNVEKYSVVEGRHNKGHFIGTLVHEIVHEIGARFYKLKNGHLTELTEPQVRQKVGHALRDMLVFQENQQQQHQQQRKKLRLVATPQSLSSKGALSPMRTRAKNKNRKKESSNDNSYNSSWGIQNQTQSLTPSPAVVPPPPTSLLFQESIISFGIPPTTNNNGDDRNRRASILEARGFSTMIDGPSFFPVSVRDQRQRHRQQKVQRQQKYQQRFRSSFTDHEEWLLDSNTNTMSNKNRKTGGKNRSNTNDNSSKTQSSNTKDGDDINIDDDSFRNIDFYPIPIDDLIQKQLIINNAHEV